ncbi:MAG: hypothetical protein M1825_004068 [Sarcosagium campestre]|nr:MAG: hypothetical protein M1825_004068 [Sarcosagium campestre]
MAWLAIEVSPNNRATCKNKDCKDQGVKITKGELRFGTWVDTGAFASFTWKHWGCVTPRQIQNLKVSIEDNLDLFDGYDELPAAEQGKMRQALAQGHVDDEDWKGDPEFNKPGMTGMHKRTPKKKAKREQESDAEGGDISEKQQTPKTTASERPQGRGRRKADSQPDGDADVRPPSKRARTAGKKSGQHHAEEIDSTIPKQPRGKRVKHQQVKAENPDTTDEESKDKLLASPDVQSGSRIGTENGKGSLAKKRRKRSPQRDAIVKSEESDGSAVKSTRREKKVKAEVATKPEPVEVKRDSSRSRRASRRKSSTANGELVQEPSTNNNVAGDEDVDEAEVAGSSPALKRKARATKSKKKTALTAH